MTKTYGIISFMSIPIFLVWSSVSVPRTRVHAAAHVSDDEMLAIFCATDPLPGRATTTTTPFHCGGAVGAGVGGISSAVALLIFRTAQY